MTMKKKLTVTTLAASMMFASIAGLPLSEKGLAGKIGLTAGVASATTYLDQLNEVHTELARDTQGLSNVNSVKQYLANHPITDKNLQKELTQEVWSKVKDKAPALPYSAVIKLINGLDLFFDDSGASFDEIIKDQANRDAISLLFTSVNLPGIDEPNGLKKSDIVDFQQAAMGALTSKKDELLEKVAQVILTGQVDSEAIKEEINEIVNKGVLEGHSELLISQLLNSYGITLGDLNAVQNRIANYIDAQSSSTIAKDARTAVESAGLRYVLKDRIKYAKSSGSTSAVELPVLSVTYNNQEYPLPSSLLKWSAAGTGIKYDGTAKAFVLTGTTSASAHVEARDSKFGLLLYISPNAITLTPVSTGGGNGGGSTGGAGGGGGAGAGGGTTTGNTSTAEQAAKEALAKLGDELKNATEARKQEIFKEAQAKVENAIKELATLDLKSLITIQGDTAKPQLNVADLVAKLKAIAEKAKALNDQLKALNPDAKDVKVQLTLNFGTINAKTTEIPLAKDLLAAAVSNGIDTIAIAMNGLSLAVSPAEFGADTTLKVTNQDTTVATSVTQLPVATGVYEFEFTSGGNKVESFNKPVEVTIPVPNGSNFDTELLSLAKIVDGKLEFYGGSYGNGSLKGLRNSFSTYTVVENKVSFEDTASVKAWAGRQIQVAAAKGILEGRAEQSFDPNGFVTRAEFAKMIVKTFSLESANATESFDDVNDSDWYKVYVASAVKNGVVNGKEAGKFDPNGQITRAEMAVMSSRALSLKGVSIAPKKVEEALKGFKDAQDINSSLQNGVALAASEGIIVGEEGNVFNPNANSTRAQAAVVIYRLLNK
ncbi:S-layer homology domain-containing protein [Paenibacillus sp. GCM10023248]|uniref:S-layer homology domain-containing protein n=1 Tax=unclassified Paenibacillus TaxID=185978 RepID=UPI002379A7F2|nr:S-layer homology domain-containing protein [Paenibacillus sp. MAHUQ-63]MDD9266230.1 S-layer homology domain-containing protein [Paenibacillus sp. MAHUQ-63]